VKFSRPAALAVLGATGVAFLVLCIPGLEPPPDPAPTRGAAFLWNRDAFWKTLEHRFVSMRDGGCLAADTAVDQELAILDAALADLAARRVEATDTALDTLEDAFFRLTPLVAACPHALQDYLLAGERIRAAIKQQSRHWDMTATAARSRVYSALYGIRLASEEVALHHPGGLPALAPGRDEPSATPMAFIEGVPIRSGDILVSRGGYPTSALIARGNDYPGNFSHIALVHVDADTKVASAIEAHIESGVAVSSVQRYLDDKKLRILVLRPRADLPAVVADPLLPHRAASAMLQRATATHIPYDFAMDYRDPLRLFCSEVASVAYLEYGITLWSGLSTISRPGLRRWLWDFGVRHFETQEPSDLEYDPQLVVVAEWHDQDELMHDRIDNAVIDAMLDGADHGDSISYRWYALPVARIAKGYSWLLNRFGRVGPVPEGMTAEVALRSRAFEDRQTQLAAQVRAGAEAFADENGYPPPYWALLELAERAATQ
jgi:hypothetical protein